MKITRRQLKRLIKEELSLLLEDVPARFGTQELGHGWKWDMGWITDPLDRYAGRADVADQLFQIEPQTGDIDLGQSTPDVRRFAAAAGLVAHQLGISKPVVTSGRRDSASQAAEMYRKWERGDDLVKLYTQSCAECVEVAGGEDNARQAVDSIISAFETSQEPAVARREAARILEQTPLSAHLSGRSIDFRADRSLPRVFQKLNRYARFTVLREETPPHWHVHVKSFPEKMFDALTQGMTPPSPEEGVDIDVDIDVEED